MLAALLSPKQLASLVISKSVKRSAGGLRWWLTLMADSGTLASLDLSWSHPSWTLRRSLARTSDSCDSGNAPVRPLSSYCRAVCSNEDTINDFFGKLGALYG